MTIIEAKTIFEDLILARWDKWKPNEYVMADWAKALSGYSQEQIKKAVFEYVSTKTMYNMPKLNEFLEILKSCRKTEQTSACEPFALFYLVEEKKDVYGRPIKHGFWSSDPRWTIRGALEAGQKTLQQMNGRWFGGSRLNVEVGEKFAKDEIF